MCLGVGSVDHYSGCYMLNTRSHAIGTLGRVGQFSIALEGSIVNSSRVANKVTVKKKECPQLTRIALLSKKTAIKGCNSLLLRCSSPFVLTKPKGAWRRNAKIRSLSKASFVSSTSSNLLVTTTAAFPIQFIITFFVFRCRGCVNTR